MVRIVIKLTSSDQMRHLMLVTYARMSRDPACKSIFQVTFG